MNKSEAFKILGFENGDTFKVCREKYKRMVQKNHPDRGGDHEVFIKIRSAWEITEGLFQKNPSGVIKFTVGGINKSSKGSGDELELMHFVYETLLANNYFVEDFVDEIFWTLRGRGDTSPNSVSVEVKQMVDESVKIATDRLVVKLKTFKPSSPKPKVFKLELLDEVFDVAETEWEHLLTRAKHGITFSPIMKTLMICRVAQYIVSVREVVTGTELKVTFAEHKSNVAEVISMIRDSELMQTVIQDAFRVEFDSYMNKSRVRWEGEQHFVDSVLHSLKNSVVKKIRSTLWGKIKFVFGFGNDWKVYNVLSKY